MSEDPQAQSICRFGFSCTRPDCKFIHPHGRRIDGSAIPPLYISKIGCKIALRPVLAGEVVNLVHVILPMVAEVVTWSPSPVLTVLWIDLSSAEAANMAVERLIGTSLLGRLIEKDVTPPKLEAGLSSSAHPFILGVGQAAPMFLIRPGDRPVEQIQSGVSAIEHLERKWAAVLAPLQQNEILMIVQLYYLPPSLSWRPLLRSLFEHGVVTVANDEKDICTILTQISRQSLLQNERFPPPDRSITLKDLRRSLRSMAGRTLILVDGDNFPNAASIGVNMFPPPLPPGADLGFLVVAFVSQAANFKSFQRAADQPWFKFVHAQTNAKDAADHVLSITATLANELCDVTSAILVLSRDGFARETVESLKTLEGRDIRLISPKNYVSMLASLGAKAGYHIQEQIIAASSPGLLQRDMPMMLMTNFTASKPRFQLDEPISTGESLHTGPPPKLQPAIPAQDTIEMPTEREPIKTNPPPANQDRTRPWRDYVCPFCHKPGGLPDSHYHWMCPERPAEDKSAPPPRYMIEMAPGREEAPPDAASVFQQEEERFRRFVATLNQLYVQRDILAIRLSTLGVVMRENFVYAEKAGLKQLVERAVELGLAERRGEQGNAELVLIKEAIINFAKMPLVAQKKQ